MREEQPVSEESRRWELPSKDHLLSARALAALTVAVTRGVNLSGEDLSLYFREGRDAFRKVIRELKDRGFVESTRQRINEDWISSNQVTYEGLKFLSESLNIDLWSRELNSPPQNVLKSFEEQLSTQQKIEIAALVRQEVEKALEAS
jgi:hypothetical protein